MASIEGLEAGLVPKAALVKEPKPEPVRKGRKKKVEVKIDCSFCGGMISKKTKASYIDEDEITKEFGGPVCRCCVDFFQLHDFGPPAPFTVDTTRDRVGRAKDEGWALILTTQKFGANSGVNVKIEMGDVLQVTRNGLSGWPNRECSIDRSRMAGSINVSVGPIPVTLFPHEFAPIKFLDVLALCKEGEMENKFVSSDDEIGFFSPTDDVRQQIKNAFGK